MYTVIAAVSIRIYVLCVQYTIEFACVVSILYAQDNDADASLQQAQFISLYTQ